LNPTLGDTAALIEIAQKTRGLWALHLGKSEALGRF